MTIHHTSDYTTEAERVQKAIAFLVKRRERDREMLMALTGVPINPDDSPTVEQLRACTAGAWRERGIADVPEHVLEAMRIAARKGVSP
jgi:hypothetical protein